MDTEMKAEKLREDERILLAIDKCLSSKDDHYEKNKAVLKEMLEDVFTTMKGRSPFFRQLFQDFIFVENYDKGPKVGKSEEFRVNIVIKIPLDFAFIEFEQGEPGYEKLYFATEDITYTTPSDKYRSFTSPWLKKEAPYYTFLKKDVFRQSIESLLLLAMLNVPRIDNYTVKVHKDSSPFTLRFNKQGFPEMNVSLVPVLELDCKPPHRMTHAFNWYAVPATLKNVKNESYQWEIVFYNHEDDLLTRHSYLKPVIRQFEKLRDTQEWNVILSYHIKTLFMHYAMNIEDDSGLPDTCNLTGIKLFIHILDELRNACKTRHLESCWVPKCNLINAEESQFADIIEKLTVIIWDITDDPAKVADWIMTSEELSMYHNELTAIRTVPANDGPSKSLQMNEESEPGSPKDILNTADEVSKLVSGANAASDDIESSPFAEAADDKAGCSEEIDLLKVIAGLRDTIEKQSRRLTALEQK